MNKCLYRKQLERVETRDERIDEEVEVKLSLVL